MRNNLEKIFFVRTQQSFAAGMPVETVLTDIESCKLKGVVKYVPNYDLMPRQNGMCIELTERDDKDEEFITLLTASKDI